MECKNMSKDSTQYHAFISYRHTDNVEQGRQWASWLHQAIETYEVPQELVGQKNAFGETIAEQIYPVFRDEQELSADADLATAIKDALERSRVLIVLCSPNSCESKYVADEIEYFKRLGRSNRILAVIIDGEPNASWDERKQSHGFHAKEECFPLPLQFAYNDNGIRTDERSEPIAADFRLTESGQKVQGWTTPQAYRVELEQNSKLSKKEIAKEVQQYEQQHRDMLLKIIAGILGVSFDQLNRRDKSYQLQLERKRAQRLRRWLSAVTVLAIVALGAGILAFYQQQVAVEQRDKAEALLGEVRENLEFMNYDLRDVLMRYAPTKERVKVMKRIDALSDVLLSQAESLTPDDKLALIVVLLQKSDVILKSQNQNPEESLPLTLKALDLNKQLFKEFPDNKRYLSQLSITYEALGLAKEILGDTQAAKFNYLSSLRILNNLLKEEPKNARHLKSISITYEHIGEVDSLLGSTDSALRNFKKSLEARKLITQLKPENSEYQRLLSVSFEKIADIKKLIGELNAALELYQQGLDIRHSLAEQDPDNLALKFSVSIAHSKLASVYSLLGKTSEAFGHLNKSKDIRQFLVNQDSTNTEFLRYYSIAIEQLGQFELDRGNVAVAHSAFKDSLNQVLTLVKLAPNNTTYQRDHLVANIKLANSLIRNGNEDEAFQLYQESLKIAKLLVERDASNISFLDDLSSTHSRMGNIYVMREQYNLAMEHYQKALDINQQIANGDMSNSKYQRGLFVANLKIGNVLLKTGKGRQSLRYYQSALSIAQQLELKDKSNIESKNDLSIALSKLGDAYMFIKDYSSALGIYQKCLQVDKEVVALDGSITKYRLSLAITYWRLYDVYRETKDIDRAISMLKKAKEELIIVDSMGGLSIKERPFIYKAKEIIEEHESKN